MTWEAVYKLQAWPPNLFPGPQDVWHTLKNGLIDQSLVMAVSASFKRLLGGYFIAVVLGGMLGVLIARFSLLSDTIGKAIMALQTIPSIAWLPFAILWFGIGDQAIIFVVALGAMWTMTLNTESGLRSVDPLYLSAAKMMNVKGTALFIKVMIPAAIPQIITGMRMAWAFAWRALLAGELIGSGTGLGQVLMLGRNLGDMSLVLAVIIIIAIQGSIVDHFIFRKMEDTVLVRWGLKKDDGSKKKQKGPFQKWSPAVGTIAVLAFLIINGMTVNKANQDVVRFGFLPNITHMPALVGLEEGTFQKKLENTSLKTYHFDGGPALMEAMSAGELDIAFVGPGPAITNYLSSKESKIIAGVSEGGTVLITAASSQITGTGQLSNKTIAVPQFGNTQDIQLRYVLEKAGLKDKRTGGTVNIIQSAPADMVTLFNQKEIDAAIVPEPWGSQLMEAVRAKVLLDSNDIWKNGKYPAAVMMVREDYAKKHPEVVKAFTQAHKDVVTFIQAEPEKAKQSFNKKLKALVNKEIPDSVLDSSFKRVNITYTINEKTLFEFAELSAQSGYIKTPFALTGLIDDSYLYK